ncbi:hypothetical protein NIES932_00420 [Raphidiopsis curvata NIES-932]|nr:hypothetical protein NIES932_00420 [Raphidiopsis curvata NIES-932]
MLGVEQELFRISQGHLNLIENCPRKFQHIYLDMLTTPTNPKQEEHKILGSRFHLLMQQQAMGLPIESFIQEDERLKSLILDLTGVIPEILTLGKEGETFRESEHSRNLQIGDYLITVIYDLLITNNEKAQIFDWKTYSQLPDSKDVKSLASHWQTKLYMYILAETSTYLPKNISMTYWFIPGKGNSKKIEFRYSNMQHKKNENELKYILEKLSTWLEQYQKNQPLPQEPKHRKLCEYCPYNYRCYGNYGGHKQLPGVDIQPIPEIEC